MRKELTWVAFALLASIFIVFVLLGNDTLDLRIRGNTYILPSWTWAFPVFFLLSFVVLMVQIYKERFNNKVRCAFFMGLGTVMILMLQSLRAYSVKLDVFLEKGQVRGVPLGAKQLLYSRNTLWVLSALQLAILVCILVVAYFCRVRTKSHAHHHQN